MVDAVFHAGVRLHLADRYPEAIRQYASALAAAPAYPAVLNNLGGAYIRTSRDAEAATALRQAARLAPAFADAYTNLAVALRNVGETSAAVDAYGAATTLLPTSASAYQRLGSQLLASKGAAASAALPRAATALAVATALSPRSTAAWELRGDAALAAGGRLLGTTAGWPTWTAAQPEATATHAEAVHTFGRALRLTSGAEGDAATVALHTKRAMAAHRLALAERPEGLAPLLSSMRALQLASADASAVWPLSAAVPVTRRQANATATTAARRRGGVATGLQHATFDGAELPGASADARRQKRRQRRACSVRAVQLQRGVGAAKGGVGVGDGGSDGGNDSGNDDDSGGGGGGGGGEEEEEAAAWGGGGSSSLWAAFATPVSVHRLGRRVAAALNPPLLDELMARRRRQPSASHSNRGGWQSPPDLLDGHDAALGPALSRLRALALEAAGAMMRELHGRAARGGGGGGGGDDAAVRLSILNAWANVNGAGHSNLYHDHPQAILSGIYFVADGGDGDGSDGDDGSGGESGGESGGDSGGDGSLELIDPRLSLRTHRPPATFEPACGVHLGGGKAAPETNEAGGGHGQLRPGYFFEHSPPLHVPSEPGTFVLFPAWLMHRVRPHQLPRNRVSVSFNMWASDEASGGGIEAVRRAFDGIFYVG